MQENFKQKKGTRFLYSKYASPNFAIASRSSKRKIIIIIKSISAGATIKIKLIEAEINATASGKNSKPKCIGWRIIE